jgi:hypothetical protein
MYARRTAAPTSNQAGGGSSMKLTTANPATPSRLPRMFSE